jgi:RimJ/RimL family protein N-acetyltransferase
MTAPTLTTREPCAEDVAHIVQYWRDATPDDLERMGVDPARLPAADELRSSFLEMLATAPADRSWSCHIWLLDDQPVGMATLKDITPAREGSMHLHMWRRDARGKGQGAILFCASALHFYDALHLQRMLCEPRRANPLPNRMLERIGFPLLGTRVGASSALSQVTELNRYHITRDHAERYLRARAERWRAATSDRPDG